MKPALEEGRSEAAGGGDRELLADFFHALNQPLTALRCSLELALLREHSAAEYRVCLRQALAQAERAAALSAGIRAWVEAGESEEQPGVVALEAELGALQQNLLPVAESRKVRLALECAASLRVAAEPRRLRQALFEVWEHALQSTREGAVLSIHAAAEGPAAVIALPAVCVEDPAGPGQDEKSGEPARTLQWAITRRRLEGMGGALETCHHEDQWTWRVRLSLASSELAPPGVG